MAPLPKRKLSGHRQGRRRRTQTAALHHPLVCPHCGALKLPHFRCPSCAKS